MGFVNVTAPGQITMNQCAKQVPNIDLQIELTHHSVPVFPILFYLTAGGPWAVPDGWDTLHPQLNLNMDDQTPCVVHNRATHTVSQIYQFLPFLLALKCNSKFVAAV